MIETLELSDTLRAQLAQAARDAFPRECCGLIEGVRDGDGVRAVRLHATPNLAREPDRFEIDPQSHFALMRALRGTGREIVGCYHSHPNGRAEPSERDRAEAVEVGFIWLIAAVSAAEPSTASDPPLGGGSKNARLFSGRGTTTAHVFDGRAFRPIRLI